MPVMGPNIFTGSPPLRMCSTTTRTKRTAPKPIPSDSAQFPPLLFGRWETMPQKKIANIGGAMYAGGCCMMRKRLSPRRCITGSHNSERTAMTTTVIRPTRTRRCSGVSGKTCFQILSENKVALLLNTLARADMSDDSMLATIMPRKFFGMTLRTSQGYARSKSNAASSAGDILRDMRTRAQRPGTTMIKKGRNFNMAAATQPSWPCATLRPAKARWTMT
mmetsp:Transcript_24502/g.78216  ORF Transcript_24502/g.78216 Transcript_24502/m.78216 type:complete len:220 (-) Transcript_24502:770-1429(-)